MFSLIGWVITGWIAGSLANWFLPSASVQPGWQTVATGVAGSIVGGVVYSLINGSDYSPAGFVFSTVGAVCCLVAYRWYTSTGGSL
jgi:uncharacterized membrane protein YeaQ/YmgE (transglycosylase-associated protein family)